TAASRRSRRRAESKAAAPKRAAAFFYLPHGSRLSQLGPVLVDGVIYSAWLFIAAVGLTLVYGVMKILNVTHGSFYALGAYAGASLTGAWLAKGYPPALSYAVLLVGAVLVTLVVAPAIERGLLRFMYAKDEVVILLVTYALFLI